MNPQRILCLAWMSISLCLVGCVSQNPDTGEAIPPEGQRFNLDEIKTRLPQLRSGMSRTQVLLILGSPAEQRDDAWIYRPARSGIFVPARALVVRFHDRLYTEHVYQPILLGGRVGSD